MVRTIGFLLVLVGLGAGVPAQREVVLPAGYDRIWSAAPASGTGLGVSMSGIVQALYLKPFGGVKSTVYGFAFRRAGNLFDYDRFDVDLELRAGGTSLVVSSLSPTFANNLPAGAAVTFPRTVVKVPPQSANLGPDRWVDFPAAKPLPFVGPNLLVQMKVFGKSNKGPGYPFKMERTFRLASKGASLVVGRGCSAATIGVAATGNLLPGSSFTLDLAGAPPRAAALLLLGTDLCQLDANTPLPLDLGPLGMTGCTLLVPPRFAFSATADSSGAARVALSIPNNPLLSELGLGFQWIHVDPAASTPIQARVTASLVVRIGPVLPPNGYVWDLQNAAATSGYTQEGGPVLRVKVLP